jgi:plastocyanin
MRWIGKSSLIIVLMLFAVSAHAQGVTVSGRLSTERAKHSKASPGENIADVVLWLTPKDAVAVRNTPAPTPQKAKLVQKDKAFHPKLLVLPAGSTVEFPNRDPFFHNVFSLFNGKRFDLGLYEAGESRTTRFERVGVSYIFCNIHPEMNAIIVTTDTPYYTTSSNNEEFKISGLLPGIYELHIFADGLSAEAQKKVVREVKVGEAPVSIGEIALPERQTSLHHTNKYGRDYETPSTSPYEH